MNAYREPGEREPDPRPSRGPAESLARRIGRPVSDCEHAIGFVRGQLQKMIAGGKIVRRDGAQGLPSDEEIADGLATARAGIDVVNELHEERANVRAAVYADGRAPVVDVPRRRRVLRCHPRCPAPRRK